MEGSKLVILSLLTLCLLICKVRATPVKLNGPGGQGSLFSANQQESNNERNAIAAHYKRFKELHDEHQQIMEHEKNQLKNEREEMAQQLSDAQKLHFQALEAMAITSKDGYQLVRIPYQETIDDIRHKLNELQNNGERNQQSYENMKKILESLLVVLYEESEIDSETNLEGLEDEMIESEIRVLSLKDVQERVRHDYLKVMSKKNLSNYNGKEIMSLQEMNEMIAIRDLELQELAQKRAYLKKIKQVIELIDKCSFEKWRGDESSYGEQHQERLTTSGTYDEDLSIESIVKEKVSLYKDLHELYRTRLSTEIVTGLTKISERVPAPVPRCSMASLLDVRRRVDMWSRRIKYAMRLSKQLKDDSDTTIIERIFSQVVKNVRNAIFTFAGGRLTQETDLEDDDDRTKSMEDFAAQQANSFDKNFDYLEAHLSNLLDIDAEVSAAEIRVFRYNMIFARNAPEIFASWKENSENVTIEGFLVEMEIAENRLRKLFEKSLDRVKSTLKTQSEHFEAALEKYRECIRTDLPDFLDFNAPF